MKDVLNGLFGKDKTTEEAVNEAVQEITEEKQETVEDKAPVVLDEITETVEEVVEEVPQEEPNPPLEDEVTEVESELPADYNIHLANMIQDVTQATLACASLDFEAVQLKEKLTEICEHYNTKL